MDPTRLLVVEDDAVSAAFLVEALAALPAQVELADSVAQARRCVEAQAHDLWLVDAHLPDGDGLDCLRALRALRDTPALAITAGAPREQLDALCAGGFLEVLMKPVSLALLHGTVRRLLGRPSSPAIAATQAGGKLPVWDEQRALAAIGGNSASLAALRRLFLQELPAMRGQLVAAQSARDIAAVATLVHKLRASCGFVGAARLGQAVEGLGRAPLDAAALRSFEFSVEDALASAETQR